MKLKDGVIIPGIGIGNIMLDLTKQELIDIIGEDYGERVRENDSIIEIQNAKFWIDNDGKIDQIGVGKDFKGKYNDVIGIGSTLKDVKKYIGNYISVYDTYELESIKGICFELEDIDEWDELTAPIEYIYVFRVNIGNE